MLRLSWTAGHQSFQGVSDPDSGFASRVGYLGVVCGDQKYSNTISEPMESVISLLSIDAPRYRTRTSPDQQIWAFWTKSGLFLHNFEMNRWGREKVHTGLTQVMPMNTFEHRNHTPTALLGW